jgi:sulfur-oxidizing protein SoxB
MVRVGGLSFSIDPFQRTGQRISDLKTVRNGQALESGRDYTVAGWASINQGTEGPPIWDVVSTYLQQKKVITPRPLDAVKVIGAG